MGSLPTSSYVGFPMTWQIVAAFSAVIGAAYLVISWLIARGLWATRQAGPNVLGVATAAIFFTCGSTTAAMPST